MSFDRLLVIVEDLLFEVFEEIEGYVVGIGFDGVREEVYLEDYSVFLHKGQG